MGAEQAEAVQELSASCGVPRQRRRSQVGLETERGIQAIRLRISFAFGGELLHLPQVKAIKAMLLGDLGPIGGSGAGARQSSGA